jgi:hypothetical protein
MPSPRGTPPHARSSPPWTGCGEPGSTDFGRVFAQPAANGAVMLSFDPAGRNHAVTLFSGPSLGASIMIYGRRFDVVRPEGGQAR